MTPEAITRWLSFMATGAAHELDRLLADDVVFCSPAVFAPQRGRAMVAAYLTAAEQVFSGTDFRYVDQWYQPTSAVLQFVANLGGVALEGVDVIQWNESNEITSFTVMVRPLRGLQTLIPLMGRLLPPKE